jgi:hypothetical protein
LKLTIHRQRRATEKMAFLEACSFSAQIAQFHKTARYLIFIGTANEYSPVELLNLLEHPALPGMSEIAEQWVPAIWLDGACRRPGSNLRNTQLQGLTMKIVLHPSRTIISIACTGAALVLIAAGVLLMGGVDYTTPPSGHFVSPLAQNINWGPTKSIRTFFPAGANLQWLAGVSGYTDSVGGAGTAAVHPGASLVQMGTMKCQDCHEAGLSAGTFASNLVNSPMGISGKDPYKDLEVQAAFDSNYLYVKVAWQTQKARPGITHQSWQLRGGTWYNNAKYKTSEKNQASQLGADEFWSLEDRLGIQLAPVSRGDSIKAFGNAGMSFTEGGCFIACHSSMREMPKQPTKAQVQADPWLGPGGLNVSDLRHYLLHTRGVNTYAEATADGNWQTAPNGYDKTRQAADLNSGIFIDLLQYRAARSAAMYGASNDAILEYRHSGIAGTNQGDNYWFDQNPGTAQPANVDELWYDASDHQWKDAAGSAINVSGYRWMYDSLITGFWALPADAVNPVTREYESDWTLKFPLIARGPDRNAVPFDAAKVQENERLPRPVLREGTGIRGAVNAFSQWDSTSNKWTVTIRRPLNKAGKCDHGDFGAYCSDHDIRLEDLQSGGQGITIGFAVFDDHEEVRYHHVSFAYHLGSNPNADIIASDNTLTGIEWSNEPKTPSLDQNYPNPFTGKTQIGYTLPEGKNVSLEIFDMYGHAVKTLVSGYKRAGVHTVTWDARNLSKGVYFYRIRTDDFKRTKTALVIE